MTTSKTKNESYLSYLILEIIMVTVITFLGVAFIVFYSTGKSDTRQKTQKLEYLFDNPLIFGLICSLPALLAVASLLFFRNRNYIIGFQLDDTTNHIYLAYRGIMKNTIKDIRIPYHELFTSDFSERKILFNQTYKGKRISLKNQNLNLDFVTNNFIWEEQPRERIHFLQELERIINNHNIN